MVGQELFGSFANGEVFLRSQNISNEFKHVLVCKMGWPWARRIKHAFLVLMINIHVDYDFKTHPTKVYMYILYIYLLQQSRVVLDKISNGF